ncbi:hypothetical protein AB1Y87_15845, partial [Citrobacter freundii]
QGETNQSPPDIIQYQNHVKLDTERFRARGQITSVSLCLQTEPISLLLIEPLLRLLESPY